MSAESLDDGDRLPGYLHRSARGELRMWLAGPTVLVFQYKGRSDGHYIDFVEDVYERTLGHVTAPIQVFVDAEHQTGYDKAFLKGIVQWGKQVLPRSDTYCSLVRSRLVAMGMAVSRVFAGPIGQHIQVVTDRNVFRTELETAVHRSMANHPQDSAGALNRSE